LSLGVNESDLTSPGQGSGLAGDLDGVPVFFIGKEAYIRNKRATGRLQDTADAEAIELSDSRFQIG
jgi:hypothetical protein